MSPEKGLDLRIAERTLRTGHPSAIPTREHDQVNAQMRKPSRQEHDAPKPFLLSRDISKEWTAGEHV